MVVVPNLIRGDAPDCTWDGGALSLPVVHAVRRRGHNRILFGERITFTPLQPSKAAVSGCKGFDVLSDAIDKATNIMQGEHDEKSLSELWEIMGQWLARLRVTKGVTNTLQAVTGIYDTVKAADRQQPTQQQCKTVFGLIGQMLSMLAKLLPESATLAASLMADLRSCVFLSTGPDEEYTLQPLLTCHDDESEAAITADVVHKKTYFQATRMLARRLSGGKDNVEALVRQKEKEQMVLETVIKVWQTQLVGRLFHAWRQARRIRLDEEKRKEQVGNLVKKCVQLESIVRGKMIREKATALKVKHAEETLSQAEAANQTLIQKQDVQLSSLKAKVKQLEAQLHDVRNESTKAVYDLERKNDAIYGLLKKITLVDFETSQRLKVAHVINNDNLTEVETLVKWVNALIVDHPLYRDVFYLDSFNQGTALLDTFYMLLGCMSPYHVTASMVEHHIKLSTEKEKADHILAACDLLDITPNIDVSELAALTPEDSALCAQNYQVFVSSLFQRFCSSDSHKVTFTDHQYDSIDPLAEPANVERLSAKEWEGKLQQTAALTTRWRAVGHAVQVRTWMKVSNIYKKKEIPEGELMSQGEISEFPQYTTFNRDRVAGLFARMSPGMGSQELDEDFATVRALFEKHYRSLRRIFKTYSMKNGGEEGQKGKDTKMTADEFWRFITDSKVSGKAYTRLQIASTFEKANSDSDDVLDASEWVEGLLRVSMGIKAPEGTPLKEKIRILIEDYVLVNTKAVLTVEFKKAIYQSPVQTLLQTHREGMANMFSFYASKNKRDKRSEAAKELDLEEYTAFIGDINAGERITTNAEAKQLFYNVLGEAASSAKGLLFHEFLEVISALACYKFPNPFLSLNQKLEAFISGCLVSKETWRRSRLALQSISKFRL